jgi:DNA-binding SARP family transcriptional activator
MEAHLALGDRAAALRCYHRYAEVLERDLAVAPGEAIGAMYQRLRAAPNRDDVTRLPRPAVSARRPAGSMQHGCVDRTLGITPGITTS